MSPDILGRVYTQYRQAPMINSSIVLYNSGWFVCDMCRCCAKTLTQELCRKFLNNIANEITVWIRRSNLICVSLCIFVNLSIISTT